MAGGLGVLALLVVVLGAPALACTPRDGGRVVFYPTTASVGDTVRVDGTQLAPGAVFEIFWGPKPDGYLLQRGTADAAGEFRYEFQVPSAAVIKAGKDFAYYQLVAYTARTNGEMVTKEEALTVVRDAGEPGSTTTNPATTVPTTIRPVPTVPGDLGAGAGPAADAGGARGAVAAPGDRALPVAPGPGLPGSPVAATAGGGATQGAAGGNAGATPVAPPDIPPFAGLLEDAEIWSGLDAERGPSLLDPPPTGPKGGFPIGPVVLGGGGVILGLAALTQVVGRRRLARAA